MKNKSYRLFFLFAIVGLVSCSDETETEIQKIGNIPDVSLDSHSHNVSKSISGVPEGALVKTKYGSFWISNMSAEKDIVSFNIIENIYTEKGYRTDQVIIEKDGVEVGSFNVYQARNPVSPTRLQWATSGAKFLNTTVTGGGLSFARYIIENDDYHLYPALAYCLDMNHDLNSIEWYLPSMEEVQSSDQNLFDEHVYWWTTGNYMNNAFPYSNSSGSVAYPKSEDYWVIAFRKQ